MNIIQFSGESTCRGTNVKDPLVAGVDIAQGDVYTQFVMFQKDSNPSHYKIQDGKLFYLPQDGSDPIAAPYGPDPAGFLKAINDDSSISEEAKYSLTSLLGLANTYINDPEGTKRAWDRAKRLGNIPAELSLIVEQYALVYNMPLV